MATRGNPFEEMQEFFRQMSDQFSAQSGDWESAITRARSGTISVDMVDRDEEYVVTANLPGFEKDDIDVRVSNSTLHIDARSEHETEQQDENYVRRERRHQSASRSLRLPDKPDVSSVNATFENGVLTVTIPKSTPTDEGSRIDIE